MIAELNSKGIVAVRYRRGKAHEPRCSHVNLPLCVCAQMCVCVHACALFRGLVYKSFIYLCMHVMKSFIKYFLRLLYTDKPHAESTVGPKMIWKFKFAKFLNSRAIRFPSN